MKHPRQSPFPLQFPDIRADADKARELGLPGSIPWSLVDPHEDQAMANHDQTLLRLAERGGLCHFELLAVLTDRQYRAVRDMTTREVRDALFALPGWPS